MLKISNMKTVEIPLDGTDVFDFGKQATLADRKIRAIVIIPGGVSPSGKTIEDPTNAYLYLKERGENKIKQEIPCSLLIYSGTFPVLAWKELEPEFYNWEESQLKFPANTTDGNAFVMAVIFDDEKSVGPGS